MGKLGEARTLGGIGSILELIPGINLVGYILTLIAVKYVSDELQDKSIFDNMLYAVLTAIVGVAAGLFIVFTGFIFSMFTLGISAILGIVSFLAVLWVFFIISAYFLRKSFDAMAVRLNVGAFKTAGMLYFIGAITTIVLVGFVILFVAYIFQIIAFFAIQDTAPAMQQTGAPVQASPAVGQAPAGKKFCPKCGSMLDTAVEYCPKCGTKQPA